MGLGGQTEGGGVAADANVWDIPDEEWTGWEAGGHQNTESGFFLKKWFHVKEMTPTMT